MIFVLDASAMIAYLRDEPGAGRVSEALLDPDGQCIAHVLNWCEVFYDFHRASGPKDALGAVKIWHGWESPRTPKLARSSGRRSERSRRYTGGFHLPIVSRWPSPTSLAPRF